jgi:hypothetical protein
MIQRPEPYVQMLRDMPWGEPQSVRDAYWAKRLELEVSLGMRDKNGERYLRGAQQEVEPDDEEAVSEPAQLSLFEVLG